MASAAESESPAEEPDYSRPQWAWQRHHTQSDEDAVNRNTIVLDGKRHVAAATMPAKRKATIAGGIFASLAVRLTFQLADPSRCTLVKFVAAF